MQRSTRSFLGLGALQKLSRWKRSPLRRSSRVRPPAEADGEPHCSDSYSRLQSGSRESCPTRLGPPEWGSRAASSIPGNSSPRWKLLAENPVQLAGPPGPAAAEAAGAPATPRTSDAPTAARTAPD